MKCEFLERNQKLVLFWFWGLVFVLYFFCHSGLYKQLAGQEDLKVALPTTHSVLRWSQEHCKSLPGCGQLPALQHPQLPLPTTRQAQAGCRQEGAQAVKQGHDQRAGKHGVKDVSPTPDIFRDLVILARHNMGQSSIVG